MNLKINLLFGQNCLHFRLYQRVFQLWYTNLEICILGKLDPQNAGRKKTVFSLYYYTAAGGGGGGGKKKGGGRKKKKKKKN